jgi:hypothetical protein
MVKSAIYIESNLKKLEPGDHIFSAEFVSDEKEDRLEIKEFEFVKYLVGNNTSEIETNKDAIPAVIFDIRWPKIQSKTDISHGFFSTEKMAVESFYEMISHIYKIIKKSYNIYIKNNS